MKDYSVAQSAVLTETGKAAAKVVGHVLLKEARMSAISGSLGVSNPTCFVIMPIGDQEYVGGNTSATDLKRRYDDLIREALLAARPQLEVVRADEVSAPGTITTDILARLMHSDYVVADLTYPNTNVFYELGLRHACRTSGTIIIREKSGPKVPFDIAHLRYIDYENTASGLKLLAEAFRSRFGHIESNPTHPDNQLQELAKLTGYRFPNYLPNEENDLGTQAVLALMESPDLLQLLTRKSEGEEISQSQILQAIASHPKVAVPMVRLFAQAGAFQPESLGVSKREPSKLPKGQRRKPR